MVHLLCQFHVGKVGFSAVRQAIYIASPPFGSHYVFNPDHYIGIVIANTTLLYKY